jgi:hypothetical protein
MTTATTHWERSYSDLYCIVRSGFKFSVVEMPSGQFALSIVRPRMQGCQIDTLSETFPSEEAAIARAELLISLERNLP